MRMALPPGGWRACVSRAVVHEFGLQLLGTRTVYSPFANPVTSKSASARGLCQERESPVRLMSYR